MQQRDLTGTRWLLHVLNPGGGVLSGRGPYSKVVLRQKLPISYRSQHGFSAANAPPLQRLTREREARILQATRRPPTDRATHWSTRKLAAHPWHKHMMVARVWREQGLKPHRIERYMASNDPDFEKKAADIIGLYLSPLVHAAVLCVTKRPESKPWIGKIRGVAPPRLCRHLGGKDESLPDIWKLITYQANCFTPTPRRSESYEAATSAPFGGEERGNV